MTVKEFYEWVCAVLAQKMPLFPFLTISLYCYCNDDWDNFKRDIEEKDLDIGEK